jgi:hypothetical protein
MVMDVLNGEGSRSLYNLNESSQVHVFTADPSKTQINNILLPRSLEQMHAFLVSLSTARLK